MYKPFNSEKIMKPKISVPESELKFSFSRSGGAGGQKVNKTETKATIHWDFKNSQILNNEQLALIQEKLKNRINELGELVVYSQVKRTQALNRQMAIKILNGLVNSALSNPPERKLSKVPKKEKGRRLEEKRRQSEKKGLRKKIDY